MKCYRENSYTKISYLLQWFWMALWTPASPHTYVTPQDASLIKSLEPRNRTRRQCRNQKFGISRQLLLLHEIRIFKTIQMSAS